MFSIRCSIVLEDVENYKDVNNNFIYGNNYFYNFIDGNNYFSKAFEMVVTNEALFMATKIIDKELVHHLNPNLPCFDLSLVTI